jgi:hypothetical protein
MRWDRLWVKEWVEGPGLREVGGAISVAKRV